LEKRALNIPFLPLFATTKIYHLYF
jgi:hypothetical protein